MHSVHRRRKGWKRTVTPLRVYAVGSAVVLLLCAETLLGSKAHAGHLMSAQGGSPFPPWWADPETLKGWAALLTAGTMFVGAFFNGAIRLTQIFKGVPAPPFDPTASGS